MTLNVNNYTEILGDSFKLLSAGKKSPNEDVVASFGRLLEEIRSVQEGGDALKKLGETLKIGVVGQVKAGKSSFLNSLFFDGESVLPKASTPMTAGLTILEHGVKDEFEVEYYNEAEWNIFKNKAASLDKTLEKYRADFPEEANATDEEILKDLSVAEEDLSARELVMNFDSSFAIKIGKESVREKKSFNGVKDLQNVLEEYVGANGKYTSIVKSLTIRLKDPRLDKLCIVDTPGVNDPVVSREMCNYFANSESGLTEKVKAEYDFLSEKCKLLKATGIEQLKAMRDNTSSIINEFVQMMGELSKQCEQMANQTLSECLSNLREPTVRIPTYTETVYSERGGTICGWLNKHDVECSCRMVDVYSLADSVSRQVESAANSASKSWMRETDKIVREINRMLKNKVEEAEKRCSKECIPGADLRCVIEETVTSMTSSREVDLSSIADDIAEEIEFVASRNQPSFPNYLGTMSEGDAKSELREIANDAVESIRSEADDLVSDFVPRVEEELSDAKESFVDVFKKNGSQLTSRIKSAMQETLRNLEAQLKEKEKQIQELERAVETVNSVKKKMKM